MEQGQAGWARSVMRRVKFGRGDIVLVNLDPSEGHEQKGRRLAMVLVAPITQGDDFARHASFAASLSGSGTKTQGVALVNQIRLLDLEAHGATRVETAPEFVVEDALARLRAITD
jgi:mRNA interferase ChpB